VSRLARAILGSARVSSRACGSERILAIADFSWNFAIRSMPTPRKTLFRRDAETRTRDACAPQT